VRAGPRAPGFAVLAHVRQPFILVGQRPGKCRQELSGAVAARFRYSRAGSVPRHETLVEALAELAVLGLDEYEDRIAALRDQPDAA